MRRLFSPVSFLAGFCVCLALSPAGFSGQLVSTMRNVRAVMEARGYRLQPAPDIQAPAYPGDQAPAQAFELIRPRGEAVNIGRLYTSCTCVRLETVKNRYAQGERAVFILRNVVPTPANGQMYAMYVQVTRPIRTTLRVDTFMQSSIYLPSPVIEDPVAVEHATEMDAEAIAPAEAKDGEETVAESAESAPAVLPSSEPGAVKPESAESAPAPAGRSEAGESEQEPGERKTVELKVTETPLLEDPPAEAGKNGEFKDVADQEVDEYVAKFLDTLDTETDEAAGELPGGSDKEAVAEEKAGE